MSNIMSASNSSWKMIYQVFKYLIYAALTYNVVAFFMEEWAALPVTFENGITSPSQIIEAFPSTIDTAAWVLLLYVFEAETFILSDDTVNGKAKYPLIFLKALCYGLIVYACSGYLAKLYYVMNSSAIDMSAACSMLAQDFSVMVDLDEYIALAADNCSDIAAASAMQINDTRIIGTQDVFENTIQLAWVDVINAFTWLLIVVVLEIDVRLQLLHKLTDHLMRVGYIVKGVLYLTLFCCAAFWGVFGDFLDFWDAFLWLVGFFMIELNIFNWHEETKGDELS